MPYILYPDIRAGGEEQPLHGNKQVTNHIGGNGYKDEEYRKSLEKNRRNIKI